MQRVEDLSVEELVTELAVKTLDVAVLPWRARLDEERVHRHPPKPIANDSGSELGAVVAPDVLGCPTLNEQLGQAVEDVL